MKGWNLPKPGEHQVLVLINIELHEEVHMEK